MAFTFGVEIECLIPDAARRGLAAKIVATGLQCVDTARYHSGMNRTAWKIEADGSLRAEPGYTTVEIVAPPLQADNTGFEQIEKVCRVLNEVDATVNRSCGLHVHVGIGNVAIAAVRKLAELYVKNEALIDQLIPPSRRGNANHYCASVASANLQAVARAQTVRDISFAVGRDARHVKLNLASYWKYSTVEFRHHSGTVDASKIVKWVIFCTKMVETACREADRPVDTAGAVADVSYATNAYWRRGRRTRAMYQLLSRPEGATAEEIRQTLGVSSRPNLVRHLRRANEAYTRQGFRNGSAVYRLNANGTVSAPAVTAAPMTLADLYEKLGLADEDKAFWQERQALLSAGPVRRQRAPRGPVEAAAQQRLDTAVAATDAPASFNVLDALRQGRTV